MKQQFPHPPKKKEKKIAKKKEKIRKLQKNIIKFIVSFLVLLAPKQQALFTSK